MHMRPTLDRVCIDTMPPKTTTRGELLTLRVTAAEHWDFERLAGLHEVSIAKLLRELVARELVPMDAEALARLHGKPLPRPRCPCCGQPTPRPTPSKVVPLLAKSRPRTAAKR